MSQITIMMHRVYKCVTTGARLSCIYFPKICRLRNPTPPHPAEQSSGQIMCTKKCTYPLCGQWMLSHRGGRYWVFLHIYTVIAQMYDPFQEYSVKRVSLFALLNRMIGNTSNFDASNSVHGVYYQNLAKVLLMKRRMVCFHIKVIAGDLTQNKST